MSLADQLLDKQKQQKLRSAASFAPNFAKKPNLPVGASKPASSTTTSTTLVGGLNKNTSNNSNYNNNSRLSDLFNESSSSFTESIFSTPPTVAATTPGLDLIPPPQYHSSFISSTLPSNPTQDNPLNQSAISNTSSSTNNNNHTTPSSGLKKADNDRKKREKKRRRKTIDSDDEDEDYTEENAGQDDEDDAVSTTSNITSTSSKSTTTKSKRLKKPTGEFKTISDFIRDAILNDYESENANSTNNRNNENTNLANQQNGISADEFINEEDEYEIETEDPYKDRVHRIEMEDDNNSDSISAVSGRSSHKNFIEVKPTIVNTHTTHKSSDNEFGDDDDMDDLDSEFGDLEKPAGGPSVFSFDREGNILLKPKEAEEVLTPFSESGRQEFNYSRAMRLANLDTNKPVTQATYARKGKGERWTKDDLELFYDGLRQFGSDFSMISRLFPKRTRREIHQKYKSEEKKNKKKIEFALKNRAPIDMTLFQKKSKEKDKIQGITRKKVTKSTEEATTENNEDEWKEVTTSTSSSKAQQQIINDNEFEDDEFYDDIDDYDPEADEKKYEPKTVSKPQPSHSSSTINNDDFEEVVHQPRDEEDETFDNFKNSVLGGSEDEFE